MNHLNKNWLNITLLNLLIVTILGVLMRYKIAFDFPLFSQKNGQQAHSNFAFTGWITYTIYLLIIDYINSKTRSLNMKLYKNLLVLLLIASYGILFSYLIIGYGVVTNILSVMVFLIACAFAIFFFRDFRNIEDDDPSKNWFKGALLFNVISFAGTANIAYIMISHQFNDKVYLASIYYYLHFQYNGFFIFSCIGLLFHKLHAYIPNLKYDHLIFKVFFLTAIPAYFLSTLWAKIPLWLYIVVIFAAIMQIVAWIMLMIDVSKIKRIHKLVPKNAIQLALFICVAFSIKLCLQLGSTIPIISKLAFGFRPIVIAYLHLVLLAIVSLFLISYLFSFNMIKNNKITSRSIMIFVAGIFFNELILGLQGIASFKYISIPYINEMLFVASLILLSGALLLFYSQKRSLKDDIKPQFE